MKGRFLKTALVICTAVSCFAVSRVAVAANIELKTNAPTAYEVIKGDTLWDISALYLDSPWLWPKLWRANPTINNPHLIYPGDKLTLIWRDGQPILELKPAHTVGETESANQALSALAKPLLTPYLRQDRLLSVEDFQAASRVVGSESGRHFLTARDTIYIQANGLVREWGIYREVETHRRKPHNQSAISLKLVALAKTVDLSAKVSNESVMTALKIVKQTQEVKVGDLVLSQEHHMSERSLSFFPSAAPAEPSSSHREHHPPEVVGMMNGSKFATLNDVVIINRGKQDQLIQGSMYRVEHAVDGVLLADQQAKKIMSPAVYIGQLMVIRTYDHFSLAMVTESKNPIERSAGLVSPLNAVVR